VQLSPPERSRNVLVTLAFGLSLPAALTATAVAAFNSATGPATQTLATTNLVAPTSLAASCVAATSNVNLTWTATTSPAAAGYVILRSTTTGGPYAQIGTVSGSSTTTFTTTIAILQTYYYVVDASRNNWRSPNSNQPGVHSLALGVCQPA
jgi:hypothetical protein